MKRRKTVAVDELRNNYTRADFPAGFVRGKFATGASGLVRLRPEIAAAFPTSAAVNAALAGILRKSKSNGQKSPTSRSRAK